MVRLLFSVALVLGISISALAQKKSPAGTKVYFISPKEGETVSNPITIRFGLKGMGIAPAGLFKEETGHHHLLIDVEKLPDLRAPIPLDDHHHHFGGGQTETTLTLTPGKHTLQLLMGDLAHVPHEPPVISEKITITVK